MNEMEAKSSRQFMFSTVDIGVFTPVDLFTAAEKSLNRLVQQLQACNSHLLFSVMV